MTTFNISEQIEQEQRQELDLVTVEAQLDRDINLYYEGRKDGSIGLTRPRLPQNQEYYAGWSESYQDWCIATSKLASQEDFSFGGF